MTFFEKIEQFLSFNLKRRYDNQIVNKIILVSFSTLLALIAVCVFTVFAFINQEYVLAGFLAANFVAHLFNFFYLKKTKRYNTSGNILIVLISLKILFGTLGGSVDQFGIFWFYIYPPAVFFVLGQKRGLYLTLAMFVIALLIFIVPSQLAIYQNRSFSLIFRFAFSYWAISFFIQIYSALQKNNQQSTERQLLETQKNIKEKSDFISRLSHKIRTPLNNILNVSDILSKTGLDDKQQDLIDTIYASTNNLVTVVNSIDKVSSVKIENKGAELNFSLYTTIKSTIELFSNQVDDQVDFNFNHQNIPQRLIGNPIQVKQIFLNIIELLIKNKPYKTQLKISIDVEVNEKEQSIIECKFSITSDKIIRIPGSQRNIKLKLDKIEHDGSLGAIDLSITRNLIELNGGKLKVDTQTDTTVFLFSLEFKKAKPKKTTTPSKETPPKETDTIGDLEKTVDIKESNVLLVEDNLINQKIMVLSLKKQVKNIDIANNGKEALDKFGSSKYDIILMDIQMPVMDGIKATKKIREVEIGTSTHTPIIAITANALMDDKDKCLNAGMDDYLSKPFKIDVLIDKIRIHLTRKEKKH